MENQFSFLWEGRIKGCFGAEDCEHAFIIRYFLNNNNNTVWRGKMVWVELFGVQLLQIDWSFRISKRYMFCNLRWWYKLAQIPS